MIIHVVKSDENINSIADQYNISVARLIQDNGLDNPNNLVPGQTIVIAYPEQTYIVRQGDTLAKIADENQISLMQLLRNNPFLLEREFIYPGETLVTKYKTGRKLATNAFAYAYIEHSTLIKTLPFLTYLSVFNYATIEAGDITAYGEDRDIIRMAKEFGVMPLMMVAPLSIKGEPNMELAYNLLLNEEYQNRNIEKMLNIMKDKGFSGVNMVFSFLNKANLPLYEKIIEKVSERVHAEGFLYFITFNMKIDPESEIGQIDYTKIAQMLDGIIIVRFIWGANKEAPVPISSAKNINGYVKHLVTYMTPDKLTVGIPTVGYEWELPYEEGKSTAYVLTINSILSLANDVGASIQFDEESQTPFIEFNRFSYGSPTPTQRIIWFTDARSIDALLDIVNRFELGGTGLWNIMIYYQQLWLIINSQYEIIKFLPDELQ